MSDMLDPCAVPGCHRAARPQYTTCYAHTPPTRRSLYRVWAAISREPQVTVRELVEQLNYSSWTVAHALRWLKYIGAIRHDTKQGRARQIVEPFNWVRWP